MNIQPVLHRIYIKPDDIQEADDKIASARKAGLIVELDKREQKATTSGTVLAIGSTAYKEFGTTAEEQGIRIGSKVLYSKYAGFPVPNTEFIVMNDEDCICVVTEDEV